MHLDIQKNKILYDYETEKPVVIKESIHYPGEKRFKVVLSYGFGAGEIKEIVYVKEQDVEIFKKRFIKKEEEKEVLILKGSIVESKNNLTGLREDLFKNIRGVADGSISLEKAKIISSTAQVLTNTFKVEIEYKKMIKDYEPSKFAE